MTASSSRALFAGEFGRHVACSTSLSIDRTVPESPEERLALALSREMRERWGRGERPNAEEYLALHPELRARPHAAVELIYEEYCLRVSAGESGAEAEMLRRFPDWATPLRLMLECHRYVLQSDRDRPRFPETGQRVGGFQLLDEIARGARGRVFLATQTALADRPVVLKLTPLETARDGDHGEHLSLARLQHTNIVPLYSVFDDATRRVRVLCMPYFGRATLASLLEALRTVPHAERTGQHIVEAIDQTSRGLGGQWPETRAPAVTPSRQMLAHVSYVEAICWIAACLSDALEFAHQRGVVHLDLKPSNVLLATDGQPMLLDFHLAREPIAPGSPAYEAFGGTPGYMPPEQQAALRRIQAGQPVETAVDRRADVYALGAMLYESLGASTVTERSPCLSRLNQQVSIGLSDIVAKCLSERPEDRYPDAQGVADDLRRYLTGEPLVGVRNRSLTERWQRWRGRRSNAGRMVAGLLLLVGASALVVSGAWSDLRDKKTQAENALRAGQRQLQEPALDLPGRAQTVEIFTRGLELARGVPFADDLEKQLQEGLASARQRQLVGQLHELAEEVRGAYAAGSLPAGSDKTLATRCLALWQKRDLVFSFAGLATDAYVATDLRDIALFTAHLVSSLPDGGGPAEGSRRALRILDEAEASLGPSPVFAHERRRHQAALGMNVPPAAIAPERLAPAPARAWEHCAMGRAFLADGDLPLAAAHLRLALDVNPSDHWVNFYYGLCVHRMARYPEAIAAFSVAIGAAPRSAVCFYNRGLAYAALDQADEAMRDYDAALNLDPTLAPAALNRGVLHLRHRQFERASADLHLALELGADSAVVHYNLAVLELAAGQWPVALAHARAAVEFDPRHEPARKLRDSLERQAAGRR